MRARRYLLFASSLLILFLSVVPAHADFFKDLLKKELIKQMAKKLGPEAPTVSSADAVFPTVPALPGPRFQPEGDADSLLSQLATTPDGSVMLPPGDYEVKVRCDCMKHSAHSPSGHLYVLAPIKGKRAAMITALNARMAATSVPAWQVQHLSWDLQAGLRYDQLPSGEQAIIDQYLSDYKRDIAESQLEQIRGTYDKYGPRVGLGSFDSALSSGELGDVGKRVLELENFQAELAENNTAAGVDSLIPRPRSDATGGPENTPWSRVSDRVYERMYTAGGYQSIGTLQIRVARGAEASADAPRSHLISGSPVPPAGGQLIRFGIYQITPGSRVNVPITSVEGEPQNDSVQPLSMVPQRTNGSTPEEAAGKAMKPVAGDSVEHGGWVVQNSDGSFSAYPAGSGDARSFQKTPPPPNVVGGWHTHPPGGGSGSDYGDQYAADKSLYPEYAADPNGDIIVNTPRPGHSTDPPPPDLHKNYNGPGVSVGGRWK